MAKCTVDIYLLIYLLKKQPFKKHFQTMYITTPIVFFYRSRTFSKKNEVCLKTCILYFLKIPTLILDINFEIIVFPLKLVDSVTKFVKKDVAETLKAWIMDFFKKSDNICNHEVDFCTRKCRSGVLMFSNKRS